MNLEFAAKAVNFLQGGGDGLLGFGGKNVAEIEFHGGDGQTPCLGGAAKEVAGQRKEGGRAGGVRQDLRGLGRAEFAQADFARRIHGGVNEDDGSGF
jgi:hypothetical protein